MISGELVFFFSHLIKLEVGDSMSLDVSVRLIYEKLTPTIKIDP